MNTSADSSVCSCVHGDGLALEAENVVKGRVGLEPCFRRDSLKVYNLSRRATLLAVDDE